MRVPVELREKLHLAKLKTDKSISEMVQEALRDYLRRVGVLVLFLLVLVPAFAFTPPEGFKYYVPVTISSSEELNGFQVAVPFDTATLVLNGKLKGDCSDLWVVDPQGNPVPFYVEECPSSQTRIWVKTDLSPANPKELFIVYGNPNAVSLSSGDAVFLAFDDFSTPSKWSLYNCEIAGGKMTCREGGSNYSVLNYREIPMWGIVVEVLWKTNDSDGPNAGLDIGIDSETGGSVDGAVQGNFYLIAPESGGRINVYEHTTSWSLIKSKEHSMPVGETVRSKIVLGRGGLIEYWEDGALVLSFSDPTPLEDDGGYLGIREWEGEVYRIYVRKFAPTEPLVAVGEEQEVGEEPTSSEPAEPSPAPSDGSLLPVLWFGLALAVFVIKLPFAGRTLILIGIVILGFLLGLQEEIGVLVMFPFALLLIDAVRWFYDERMK